MPAGLTGFRSAAFGCGLALIAAAAVALGPGAAPAAAQCYDNPGCTDVSISGHSEPHPIQRGERSQIVLKPKNDGPGIAYGVEVHADVPAALAILGTQVYGGSHCDVDGTFVQCYMGDFVNQQRGEVKIDVRGRRVGTWISDARVWFKGSYDPNGGNGQVSTTTQVRRPRDDRRGGTALPGGDRAGARRKCATRRSVPAQRRCLRRAKLRRCVRGERARGERRKGARKACKRKLRRGRAKATVQMLSAG